MNKQANFLDGEQRHKQYPTDFPIPSETEKSVLQIGDKVEVGLEDYPTEHPIKSERFWVELTAINESQLTGTVIDDLVFAKDHGVDDGDTLSFERRHVLDIEFPLEEAFEVPSFIDGEESKRQNPTTSTIPTKRQKQALKVGDLVCVGFAFPSELGIPGERFWVEVTTIKGADLTGTIDDELMLGDIFNVNYGDTISFKRKHVLTIRPCANHNEVTPESGRAFLRGTED
jgi:hypothetical protein